ncbi:MAG: hypothetical protein ACRDZ8_14570, partial [Acidimicrobiales bacterium]
MADESQADPLEAEALDAESRGGNESRSAPAGKGEDTADIPPSFLEAERFLRVAAALASPDAFDKAAMPVAETGPTGTEELAPAVTPEVDANATQPSLTIPDLSARSPLGPLSDEDWSQAVAAAPAIPFVFPAFQALPAPAAPALPAPAAPAPAAPAIPAPAAPPVPAQAVPA